MPDEAMTAQRSVTALPHGRRAHMGDLRIPIFPHHWQHLTLSVFFIIAILVGMKCYFIVLLIWFDAQEHVEHLFMCFFIGYLYIFFVEMAIQILRSLLKWVIYLLIVEL